MRRYVVIVIAVLILAALACGQSNVGEKVDVQESAPTSTPGVQTYEIGDVISIQNHTIVLNSAEIEGDVLKANFSIENVGQDEVLVSSMIDFEAKADDGTKLVETYGSDCSPSLGGSVLSGDKLKGPICWEGLETDTARIYYRPDFLGKGAIVWEISK